MSARMLVIAPHPDDEILGAGGTMARFARGGGQVTVLTVAAHMPPLYPPEVHVRTVAEARRAHAVVGVTESIFLDYPAVCMNETPMHEVNARIQAVVHRVEPHIVLLPYPDRHIDHRLTFDGAMVAVRPVGKGRTAKMVAAYETLSETHWNAPHVEPNFTPNWCIDVSDSIEIKMLAMGCYESQIQPYPGPRSLEALKALALFRGSQAGFGYGEAFHVLRLTAAAEDLLT